MHVSIANQSTKERQNDPGPDGFVFDRLSAADIADGITRYNYRVDPSNYPLSSNPRAGSRVRAIGSWDRAACRTWDISGNAPMLCPDDRSFRLLQRSCRNCTAPETF